MSRDALIQGLTASLHETLAAFDTPEAALNRSYAPGKWTLRQILIHLSDTETVLLDRLRRMASEHNPALIGFDENLWVSGLAYDKRDLGLARQQFEAARRSVIELAKILGDNVDARIGTHSEAGKQTFGDNLKKVHEHSVHHMEQARACIEGKSWTPKKK
jgi:hypothetical protein